MHAGSWELSNIVSANLGVPFRLFVRDLRYPRLNALLNSYRNRKGCRIIQRQNQTRQLIEVLAANEAVGMTLDQGGKSGVPVEFFGHRASMSTGAVKLALKYGATLLPVLFNRINGPYIKIVIEPPFEFKKSPDLTKDIKDNVQGLARIFQEHIINYPDGYLWTYKIWKYSDRKVILILSDGKTGHLRQSQAVAGIIRDYYSGKGIAVNIEEAEVEFRSGFSRSALALSACLSGKYHCQGCLWCMKTFLKPEIFKSLSDKSPDLIVSCGSRTAEANYILSRENNAKSIVIMRPSLLSRKRFDLVILPRHDRIIRGKNVVVTDGALNLIDEEYLKRQSQALISSCAGALKEGGLYLGVLLGGDTREFSLKTGEVSEVLRQVTEAAEKINAGILITTSRRTSNAAEQAVKDTLKDSPRVKLMVIANEKNIPEAVGGILGLSGVIISSPESISMISEAATSGKYVLVFGARGLSRKHNRFLKYFSRRNYIFLSEIKNLSRDIQDAWVNKRAINTLSDKKAVKEALAKIL